MDHYNRLSHSSAVQLSKPFKITKTWFLPVHWDFGAKKTKKNEKAKPWWDVPREMLCERWKYFPHKRMTVASVYPTIISQNLLKVSPNANYNLLKFELFATFWKSNPPTLTFTTCLQRLVFPQEMLCQSWKYFPHKRMTIASVYPTIISQNLLKVSPNATYNLLKFQLFATFWKPNPPMLTFTAACLQRLVFPQEMLCQSWKYFPRKRMTVASVYPTIISQNLLKVSPNANYNLLKFELLANFWKSNPPTLTFTWLQRLVFP